MQGRKYDDKEGVAMKFKVADLQLEGLDCRLSSYDGHFPADFRQCSPSLGAESQKFNNGAASNAILVLWLGSQRWMERTMGDQAFISEDRMVEQSPVIDRMLP